MKPAKPPQPQASQRVLSEKERTGERVRLPLAVPIETYLRDHHWNGKVIVPAVEILQRLAASLQSQYPGAPVICMRSAAFDRFLQADDDCAAIEACHELEREGDGSLVSRLTTSSTVAGGVRRTKVHAAVEFTSGNEPGGTPPVDIVSALDGIASAVPAEKVYAELVPFGPAYQNITGSVFLSADGASGLVRGAEVPAPSVPLGSPFPLDAAMHVACAWGQRFCGYVAFPVGFAERLILQPTRPGEKYYCRVLPSAGAAQPARKSFLADILIYTLEGSLCEKLRGVIMKDVSGGRTLPPAWAGANATQDKFRNIRGNCLDFSVIDAGTVAAFAERALSRAERERYEGMGERRRRTYLAGRLALKRLTRKLSGGDVETAAPDIHTIMPDGVLPRCPVPGISCSLSHDSRYAFAVADRDAVGVDVEKISARVMKSRHLYMSKEERNQAEIFPSGPLSASLRVWSIKEGLSKASAVPLPECWKITEVCDIGERSSRLKFNGKECIAFHDLVGDHLFTLVKSPRS